MAVSPDFERILAHSPNSYMLLDRELRYVWANEAYLRSTGSSLADLVGKHVLAAFPHDPGDADNGSVRLLRESLEQVLATGERHVIALIPYRIERAAGAGVFDERLWSATHTPLLDEHGKVAFVLQHTVDVTELHQQTHGHLEAGVLRRAQIVQEANAWLDAERRHLRSLFEQAPGFMAFLRGPEHIFEIANNAYYQVVGHRDIIGARVRDALPDVEGQGIFELLDRVFETGERYVGRGMRFALQRHPGADLDELFLDFVFEPILDDRGLVTGIFVQGHDITAQKRLETELARLLQREREARSDAEAARADAEGANRLKDEFLATLSHELRTPLNALLGWSRILRMRTVSDDVRKRAAEVIERNAGLQAKLVEDILDVSRIITGKLRLHVHAIDLRDVVDAAIDTVTPAAEGRDVTIERRDLRSVSFVGDPERLQQVVWNLLSNAVKFTPPAGQVRISLVQGADAIELTVSDTGMGIERDFLPHVFDRFRQAEAGFDRAHGGLGLGLAIVKHVVEAHGGEVTAFSEGRGKGATFTVRLPITVPSQAHPSGSQRQLHSS